VANVTKEWTVLILSSHVWPLEDVLPFAEANPQRQVLVLLGDEFVKFEADRDERRRRFQALFNLFPRVLRQYALGGSFDITKPVFEMPLGYAEGMFERFAPIKLSLRPPESRRHIWSFVGDQKKEDRVEMITKMTQAFGSAPLPDSALSMPLQMRKLYENSIFVPIGMGNWNANCFRIYEALSCGAIPVIVLPLREREYFFGGLGKWENESDRSLPPFVFLKSWSEAPAVLSYLLKSRTHFNLRVQLMNIQFWHNIFLRTAEELKNPQVKPRQTELVHIMTK
jgi:hypothetical protein